MSAGASDFRCPHCLTAKMLEQTWGGVAVRICMRCGSNFFAAGSLAAFEGWGDDLPPEAERVAAHHEASVHCPACGHALESLAFPMEPTLELERCPSCRGIVLDFEEIRRVPAVGRWVAERAKARAGQ